VTRSQERELAARRGGKGKSGPIYERKRETVRNKKMPRGDPLVYNQKKKRFALEERGKGATGCSVRYVCK